MRGSRRHHDVARRGHMVAQTRQLTVRAMRTGIGRTSPTTRAAECAGSSSPRRSRLALGAMRHVECDSVASAEQLTPVMQIAALRALRDAARLLSVSCCGRSRGDAWRERDRWHTIRPRDYRSVGGVVEMPENRGCAHVAPGDVECGRSPRRPSSRRCGRAHLGPLVSIHGSLAPGRRSVSTRLGSRISSQDM